MNTKQLSALVVVVGIVLLYQLGMMMRQRADSAARKADAAVTEETKLLTQLKGEEKVYSELEGQSSDLIAFVGAWEPYFAIIEEQEAAETGISMKVREANMLNLSQRYEQVPHMINNKPNDSLPILVRATLLFDDGFAKLLNWMGMMEEIKPTMRVGKIDLSKGSRGEDIQMEMVLEVPLRATK